MKLNATPPPSINLLWSWTRIVKCDRDLNNFHSMRQRSQQFPCFDLLSQRKLFSHGASNSSFVYYFVFGYNYTRKLTYSCKFAADLNFQIIIKPLLRYPSLLIRSSSFLIHSLVCGLFQDIFS